MIWIKSDTDYELIREFCLQDSQSNTDIYYIVECDGLYIAYRSPSGTLSLRDGEYLITTINEGFEQKTKQDIDPETKYYNGYTTWLERYSEGGNDE